MVARAARLRRRSRHDQVGVVGIETDPATAYFLDGIGDLLGTPQRRENFARYALGLIGDGDRKTAETLGRTILQSIRCEQMT